ncbi:MAG: transaldolase [Dehalococcoidia bacterium]|nr:transaldolase [Dehalococcoidia bacterium]
MEIFVDSADPEEIIRWTTCGIADGVTTNPSVMLKDKAYDLEDGSKAIARWIHPRPLSVEVTTNDLDEMLDQSRRFASWAPNIVIKIPQENQFGVPCYGIMNQLEKEGIRVNATVAMSFGQVMLSAKAGASYISIFWGRVGDEGGNPSQVISDSVKWLEHWKYKSRVVVGSIRSVADVLQAATAGAHIVTIPPQFIAKMADHKYTRATVAQFMVDAQKALEKMTLAAR